MACQIDELAVQPAVIAQAVAGEFHIDISLAEKPDQALGGLQRALPVIRQQGPAQRAVAVAGEG